ncbi:MAG TPA: N-acetylmuramic acid 6-phosphate etherase [Thermotogota bacterium]|nr:N-acetylmuramic acid 6-phosphate etherase [Thermotogota bacterium]HPJ89452.1 N-acetylmuramic acid 6-phosphate etherase [Thermotogota bacterium]HPR95277.1 N-acetylmuramic acid 6-phosphate etherase [Thermotogota bacterium]
MKHLDTEMGNPKTVNIDSLPVRSILKIMNEEDATVSLCIREALPSIEKVVEKCIDSYKKGGRIIYLGAGTSGRLAIVDAVETVPTFNAAPGRFSYIMAGGLEAVYKSLESVEDNEEDAKKELEKIGVNEKDIVIGLTASGRTPFVKGGLVFAAEKGAKTALIANVENPELAEFAEEVIKIVTGPEVITGSTRLKAGTSQKMVLNMISTATMIKQGKVYGNHMVDVLTLNEKLKIRATNMVSEITGVEPEKARKVLEACGWKAKTAIVQILVGVDTEDAQKLLDNNDGFIGKAVKGAE